YNWPNHGRTNNFIERIMEAPGGMFFCHLVHGCSWSHGSCRSEPVLKKQTWASCLLNFSHTDMLCLSRIKATQRSKTSFSQFHIEYMR
uniref:Uncharacterized protein n=1 Tax=Esox lucius TaxID=8010 RepID=A0AAY5JW45_ESOLU